MIPELGRSPGEGNGNPLQYSCLENPMDRGAWHVTVHGVAEESEVTKQQQSINYKSRFLKISLKKPQNALLMYFYIDYIFINNTLDFCF